MSHRAKPIWSAGQPEHDESSDPTSRLQAKKKTLAASEQKQPERASWREQTKTLDVKHLLFIAQCGSNIALRPTSAWALKGQRAPGSAPRNRGKNTTLMAACSAEGMGQSLLLEGAAQAATFAIYVEQILAPRLHPGQMLVMDHARIQTGKEVPQALEARGCQLLFLPSSSPDFCPIEEAFSKLKAFLRRAEARTHQALQEASSEA